MGTGDQQARRLRRALAKLEPRARKVFLLHRVEGLSYGEIAARLGITAEAVERYMADAIYQLGTRMDRYERPWWRFW